jgi:hypothetical protein
VQQHQLSRATRLKGGQVSARETSLIFLGAEKSATRLKGGQVSAPSTKKP